MTGKRTIDPYIELGLHSGADSRAVRRAYHVRARLDHPDLGGDPRRMVRLNAAYELLKDAKRRAAYDAEQSAAAERAKRPSTPSWTGAAGPPPGRPSGPVLSFGIFAGWSLGEIVRRDAGYLVWLSEHKDGRPYLEAIERFLAPLREPARRPGTEGVARR